MGKTKGGFTLPGESGYEKLTLEMAEKWGADVIRDSDGTELSPEIINAEFILQFVLFVTITSGQSKTQINYSSHSL